MAWDKSNFVVVDILFLQIRKKDGEGWNESTVITESI